MSESSIFHEDVVAQSPTTAVIANPTSPTATTTTELSSTTQSSPQSVPHSHNASSNNSSSSTGGNSSSPPPKIRSLQDIYKSGRRKYRLQRDIDVRFLLLGQMVVPEVYVDLVEKVAKDVRDQSTVPPRRSPISIGVSVAPSPPLFATESVHTTQQFGVRLEVPIWDGDNDIPDTFITDEQERVDANESYSSYGDEIHESREVFTSPKDDSDLDGQDDTDKNTQGQNQLQCGAYRQTYDARPTRWVVP
ncbi:hypothetical protein LWI29_011772 [Acer saccharum]|uniref:Uncharacterized protein n=1 Tax=Acer saccharum TaxID=4024 RepID=A0AA39VV82_ACESA|nr:hypothetical protein LWI29_011772 [Acer saccharum]